ncbi:MAG: M13 family metallopeptidase [Gemmatimonadetes bacterium]|nr:M13 family metallopeptidase [Gemmatimonadota bacterium]
MNFRHTARTGTTVPALTAALALALAAALLPAQTAAQGSQPAPRALGVDTTNFDRSVRPQDDFYRFVNGAWLERTEIPADRSRYGTFDELREASEGAVRDILQETLRSPSRQRAGSDEQKVADLYEAFLNTARIERLGLDPLASELYHIRAVRSVEGLPDLFAHLQRIGVQTPISVSVGQDQRNAEQYIGVVSQSGLGLPNRDYYLQEGEAFDRARQAYISYLTTLLRLSGDTDAAARAREILALETEIARHHWTPVANRDREATYNRHEWNELRSLGINFAWDRYLTAYGVQPSPAVIVRQPDYLQALDGIIARTPILTWQRYLTANLLHSYAEVLPAAYDRARFDFAGRALQGLEAQRSRDLRATNAAEGALGDILGKLYVERHFDAQARQRMQELIDNLTAAFRVGIDGLEWMGQETKRDAHAKLAAFNTKIGHPDSWRDYADLEVSAGDALGNATHARLFGHQRMTSRLGNPVDRDEWFMSPQTVNAYYSATLNEIVFPAGILQPPFFDVNADDAVNYGAIGAVIGHEISHGFDDQGRLSDARGNLRDWWQPADAEAFEVLATRLADQYSGYEPLAGMNLQGRLGLGENIADLSGVAVAYEAYRLSLNGQEPPVIGGFTGDQRFFLGWAQVWRTNFREEALRQQILQGPHSPGEFRVIGVLSNSDAFHEAFDVQPGHGMYRAPEDRIRIW